MNRHQIVHQRVQMPGLLPDQHSGFAVMDVGRADISPQHMAHRVNNHKPLAAFDEFAAIKANLSGGSGTVLHTLRVNDGYRGQGRIVRLEPVKHGQLIGNQKPRVILGSLSEIPVYRLPCRESGRRITPDNAVFGHIKDCLDDPLKRPNAFSTNVDEFFDTLPLRGHQVGGVRSLHTT